MALIVIDALNGATGDGEGEQVDGPWEANAVLPVVPLPMANPELVMIPMASATESHAADQQEFWLWAMPERDPLPPLQLEPAAQQRLVEHFYQQWGSHDRTSRPLLTLEDLLRWWDVDL